MAMAMAKAKFIRMSPRKLRRVVNVVRGKDTREAQVVLKFMPYAAARVVEKVLNSAVANAKENESLNPDELRISKAYVDGSTTLKRWRAMSKGRGYPILKRTSHVTIEVVLDPALAEKKDRKFSRHEIKKHEHGHKHEHKHGQGHGQGQEHKKDEVAHEKPEKAKKEKQKQEKKIEKAEKAEKQKPKKSKKKGEEKE